MDTPISRMSRRAFYNEFAQCEAHELYLQADSINAHVGPGSSLTSFHQDHQRAALDLSVHIFADDVG